ncbi:MAG: putative Na+/H+ antiporter [Vallitaleaceae bacterium]|nr:putative Na+/H+ antiporter [Vallitaleaceae bacterium]
MSRKSVPFVSVFFLLLLLFSLFFSLPTLAHEASSSDLSKEDAFPKSQESYEDQDFDRYGDVLLHRIEVEPFNILATLIFFLAIAHTMLTSVFQKKAHHLESHYQELVQQGLHEKNSHSILASLLHMFGEVEVVFGLWSVVLGFAIAFHYDWLTFVHYVNSLHYTEPLFVIVIMTIASSRPVVKLFEFLLGTIVKLFGNTLDAWWLVILILAPLLGSFITEPAAMTIGAFLLADKFYNLNPSKKLQYTTLALLFVNISIGGVLTNFAAPPVLMVAETWDWSTGFMFFTFGIKSILAISLSTVSYYFIFKKDLAQLKEPYNTYLYKRFIQKQFISKKELEESFEQLEQIVDKRVSFSSELDAYSVILRENIKELAKEKLSKEECEKYDIENAIDEKFNGIKYDEMCRTVPGLLPIEKRPAYMDPNWDQREDSVPLWIMLIHLGFLLWTVFNAHEPVLFMAGFLFFLGFYQASGFYQNRLDLKPALLVAFFLAGLMIHGTLQGWWIAPLLGSLPELGLNLTAIVLTAFNDNAAITYLSTLVTDFPDELKYSIVSGAITGGGLTLIANAPNPVGQSILKKYFENGISSALLLKFALLPTLITAIIFNLFK